jgi:hypothetical protein
MKKVTDKALTVLANWWFDQFIANTRHDNGAREVPSMMAGMIADKLAETHQVTEEQRQPFVAALIAGVNKEGKRQSLHGLSSDYDPGTTLAEAMEAAGIDCSRCPWKTNVNFDNAGITISAGYAASHELLCNIDGEIPLKRWVLETKGYQGRRCIKYDYSLFAHHGAIASHLSYCDAEEERYVAWEEVRESPDAEWRRV